MHEHHISVARTARYLTWGAAAAESTDVWFVLHGYAQLAARMARQLGPLERPGRAFVAPEGLSRFYVTDTARAPGASREVGASWMTREDRLAEIADYVAYLDAVYAEVWRPRQGPPGRVTVLAFSQGVATACRWLAEGGARVQRVILWAGEVPPDLDLAGRRERLAALALTLVVGRRDPLVTPKVLARDTARLTAYGVPFRVLHYDGGHDLDAELLRRLGREAVGEPPV
jgi:predicted esterase